MSKKKLKIDIVSDVACPWCYVGKKQFEKALDNLRDLDLEVNWRPFQLDPTIPEGGLDRETYLVNKFGSLDKLEGMMDRLKEVGKRVDIEFKDMNRIPNTKKMHNLMHVAAEKGFSNDLKEAFFEAYFEKSLDMTDNEVIFEITDRFGWTRDEAKSIMEDEEIAFLVNQQIRDVQNRGVSGVPFFILNDQYGVSGAQPPEVLEKWIRQTGAEIAKKDDAAQCAVDDPEC